jgi:hypothetical protein
VKSCAFRKGLIYHLGASHHSGCAGGRALHSGTDRYSRGVSHARRCVVSHPGERLHPGDPFVLPAASSGRCWKVRTIPRGMASHGLQKERKAAGGDRDLAGVRLQRIDRDVVRGLRREIAGRHRRNLRCDTRKNRHPGLKLSLRQRQLPQQHPHQHAVIANAAQPLQFRQSLSAALGLGKRSLGRHVDVGVRHRQNPRP